MTDTLSALVRDKWSSLLLQDFEIPDEDTHPVVLESPAVQVVAVHDPRGEVDVSVRPRSREWPNSWSYAGMVGTASVGRLLELALAEMRAEPAILDGDPDFYERLGRGTRRVLTRGLSTTQGEDLDLATSAFRSPVETH